LIRITRCGTNSQAKRDGLLRSIQHNFKLHFQPVFNQGGIHENQTQRGAHNNLLLLRFSHWAQTKPDLSGTWKMNREKSKWEALDNIRNLITKIEHKELNFYESVTITSGGSDLTVEGNYNTDGKESEVRLPSGTTTATAKWEGNAPIIEWTTNGANVRRKYALSADGKTLTVTARRYTQNSEVDETTVFEKQ
jgi:hypothetical protein